MPDALEQEQAYKLGHNLQYRLDRRITSTPVNPYEDIDLALAWSTGLDDASKHIHQTAFFRGVRAFREGQLDCPFKNRDSLLAKEWERGFNHAYFINQKFNETRSYFPNFVRAKPKGKSK